MATDQHLQQARHSHNLTGQKRSVHVELAPTGPQIPCKVIGWLAARSKRPFIVLHRTIHMSGNGSRSETDVLSGHGAVCSCATFGRSVHGVALIEYSPRDRLHETVNQVVHEAAVKLNTVLPQGINDDEGFLLDFALLCMADGPHDTFLVRRGDPATLSAPHSMIRHMGDTEGKHVFISYVREDSDAVDGLCAVLDAAQIPYWRDRTALGPGDAWKAKIRSAIRDGSLVFLACFSDNSRAKPKSYMNEELTLAVDEFRQMPPGRTWLIPVRFDSGDVPDWDLGAGRMLSDLNYSDLFGKDHLTHAARLVITVSRLLGEKRPDPATALASVAQATSADRVDLLKRLTKEMLLEPSRRIELDDLVSQEVQRVLDVLLDKNRLSGPLDGTNEDKIVRIAEEARDLWRLTEPFCASLQVACRWGTSGSLAAWANGLRSLVAAATKVEGGISAFLELRQLPGMVCIMTAALACVSCGNWANLKTVVVDPSVRDKYGQMPLPILEATDPYKPFSGANDLVVNALARAATKDMDLRDALKDFTERSNGKYHTPVAEWLHQILRPTFVDQWHDEDMYSAEFDRAEVVLGVLTQDLANMRAATNPDGRTWPRSHWFGRSTWRSMHSHGNPVADLAYELKTQGTLWNPLKDGLFGGEEDRAHAALESYQTSFSEIAIRRSF